MKNISFEDFKKIDLRVGEVLEAVPVEEADKLLKLRVDLGGEERQLVAGLAESHTADDLVGKRVVVVANLEPKELMGVESQGMLLAAEGDEGPVILVPEKEVEPGSDIK